MPTKRTNTRVGWLWSAKPHSVAIQDRGDGAWSRRRRAASTKLADATVERWTNGAWRDKVGAGFTISMGSSGDKLSTLHYFFTLAMQHGMIWADQNEPPLQPTGINRLGSASGPMAQAGQESPDVAPNEVDERTGESFGRRVAQVIRRWTSGGGVSHAALARSGRSGDVGSLG